MIQIYTKSIVEQNGLFGDFEIRYFESLRKPFMASLPSLKRQSLLVLDKSIAFYIKNMVGNLLEDKEVNKEATQLERVNFRLLSVSENRNILIPFRCISIFTYEKSISAICLRMMLHFSLIVKRKPFVICQNGL